MLVAEDLPECRAMPGRVHTVQQMRHAQLKLIAPAAPPATHQELPLTAAIGHVLARRTLVADTNGRSHALEAGTRLDWYHLPRLAAQGQATLPVFLPLHVGLVVMRSRAAGPCGDEERAGLALVMEALGQLGASSVVAVASGEARSEAPALRRAARHCDLLVVIDTGAADGHSLRAGGPGRGGRGDARAATGLPMPAMLAVDGRPCVVLPYDWREALGAFVAFVAPLVRRMQGRTEEIAPLRTALDAGLGAQPIGRVLTCVSASGHGDAVRVRPVSPAAGPLPRRLDGIAGIAWAADELQSEMGRAVAYLPLIESLH